MKKAKSKKSKRSTSRKAPKFENILTPEQKADVDRIMVLANITTSAVTSIEYLLAEHAGEDSIPRRAIEKVIAQHWKMIPAKFRR